MTSPVPVELPEPDWLALSPGRLGARSQCVILPLVMMKFTRAVVPVPPPQPCVAPPGPERSVSLNSASMYGPRFVADTYSAPHGSSRLTSSAAARLWSTNSSPGPLKNTLGIWKYPAAARTCPVRSAVDQPLITSTDRSNALGLESCPCPGSTLVPAQPAEAIAPTIDATSSRRWARMVR